MYKTSLAAVACTQKNENLQVLFNLLSQKVVDDSLNVINLKEFCKKKFFHCHLLLNLYDVLLVSQLILQKQPRFKDDAQSVRGKRAVISGNDPANIEPQ